MPMVALSVSRSQPPEHCFADDGEVFRILVVDRQIPAGPHTIDDPSRSGNEAFGPGFGGYAIL